MREIKKGQIHRLQLKHLETEGTPEEIALGSEERVPEHEVLQTVTVSLAEVKRDLSSWIAPMKAEYLSPPGKRKR